MAAGLIGRKVGMVKVYTEDGTEVPATVIQAGPCVVVQRKTKTKEGYDSVQVGFGVKKKNVNLPEAGRFKKANVEAMKILKEFRVKEDDNYEVGSEFKVDMFTPGDYVDVSGVSKGKGFSGVMKRHGFGGAASNSHGTHKVNRKPGSIGMSATPARVFKGTKMAGRAGASRSSIQNLKVVRVDAENNMLFVKGPVAGFSGSYVIIQKAKKK
jgi:large subunit ribosomal protein L3